MNLLVILNKEYFAIVEKSCSNLRKPAQFCAAKLIHYFANWAQWKKRVQRTEWIYQKLKDIKEDLMHEHSMHQIREAIQGLIEAGILEKRSNPGNGQDKTFQYKINLSKIHHDARRDEIEIAKFQAENPSFNVETHTYNQSIRSNQKIRSTQEEGKNKESEKPKENLLPCTLTPKTKKAIPDANKNSGQEKSSDAARQVLKKYEDRLKLYGIRFQRWDGVAVVDNPLLERAIANLSHLPGETIEAGVRRFLGYIGSQKDVRDVYALMVFEIQKGDRR